MDGAWLPGPALGSPSVRGQPPLTVAIKVVLPTAELASSAVTRYTQSLTDAVASFPLVRIPASVSLLIAADTHFRRWLAAMFAARAEPIIGCIDGRPGNNTCAMSTAAILRSVTSNGAASVACLK
jgi:hypothetical protein